jgi:hypothetical protein
MYRKKKNPKFYFFIFYFILTFFFTSVIYNFIERQVMYVAKISVSFPKINNYCLLNLRKLEIIGFDKKLLDNALNSFIESNNYDSVFNIKYLYTNSECKMDFVAEVRDHNSLNPAISFLKYYLNDLTYLVYVDYKKGKVNNLLNDSLQGENFFSFDPRYANKIEVINGADLIPRRNILSIFFQSIITAVIVVIFLVNLAKNK